MSALTNFGRFFAVHPLTRGRQLDAWWRLIRWQIRSRMQHEVVVPWVNDQRLAVSRGMTGATGNIYAGLHEFTDMMVLAHFLQPGDLFIDVGANVGTYTVLASGVCGATTSAFEPDPGTAGHLRRNVALNGLGRLVTVHELALGEAEATISFTIGLDTVNRVATEGERNIRLVAQKRLDSLMAGQAPAMIKMDVEGHEESVVRGALETLSAPSLKVIELETISPFISDQLARRGFERAYYDPFSRRLARAPGELPSSNALFVRDFDVVGQRLATAAPVRVLGRSI